MDYKVRDYGDLQLQDLQEDLLQRDIEFPKLQVGKMSLMSLRRKAQRCEQLKQNFVAAHSLVTA